MSKQTAFYIGLAASVVAIVILLMAFSGIDEVGVAPTPAGYTKVGEDLSCKTIGNQTLWYDNYRRANLPATNNDGSCVK